MADESPWERLAAAVVARRNERGWTQVEVASRGDLSLDRLQAIEGVRATSYRPKTMQALERGLEWMPGSVARVLAGAEPEENEKPGKLDGAEPLVDLLEQVAGQDFSSAFLDSVVNRMFTLELDEREIVNRTVAGVPRTPGKFFQRRTSSLLRQSLEKVLKWEPGTINNFMLAERQDRKADDEDPERTITAGEVLFTETTMIAESGLPEDVQDELTLHVAKRRREFNESVAADLEHLITTFRKRLGPSDEERARIHRVLVPVAEALRRQGFDVAIGSQSIKVRQQGEWVDVMPQSDGVFEVARDDSIPGPKSRSLEDEK